MLTHAEYIDYMNTKAKSLGYEDFKDWRKNSKTYDNCIDIDAANIIRQIHSGELHYSGSHRSGITVVDEWDEYVVTFSDSLKTPISIYHYNTSEDAVEMQIKKNNSESVRNVTGDKNDYEELVKLLNSAKAISSNN